MAFDFILLELATVSLLFGLYFRYLPDTRLQWREIWPGALLTAGFLVIGKSLIGFFISTSTVADLYDAAGSILVLMCGWIAMQACGTCFKHHRARKPRYRCRR